MKQKPSSPYYNGFLHKQHHSEFSEVDGSSDSDSDSDGGNFSGLLPDYRIDPHHDFD